MKHINTYLREYPFLKNYLLMDPTGNQLFDLIRDGVLLW
jgi:plastin-1